MDDLKRRLIRYGIELMATQLGQPIPTSLNGTLGQQIFGAPMSERLSRAVTALQAQIPSAGEGIVLPLHNLFYELKNLVGERLASDDQSNKLLMRAWSTDLNEIKGKPPSELWQGFIRDLARLPDGAGTFETFTSLVTKYGSFVRGTVYSDSVSVYEQFKAIVAVAHTLPDDEKQNDVLLVSGDLPGIQEMLYTITSRGVAKGLRGRSFYLQLLNDALVRVLLRELNLPFACVIYNAGGNFKLLARASDASKLPDLKLELNRRLLALHRGELRLALVWSLISADDLATTTFAHIVQQVDQHLSEDKRSAWAQVEAWRNQHDPQASSIFDPIGFGGLAYCVVCHVELDDAQREQMCEQCKSFEKLGEKIRDSFREAKLAVVSLTDRLNGWPAPQARQRGKPTWEDALRFFGFKYVFGSDARAQAQTVLYRLNDSDLLESPLEPACAYAFRPLANFTPFVEAHEELKRLRECLKDEDGDEVNVDYIRSTTLMAKGDATGIQRYGVLRMDVDRLGVVWQDLDLLATSTLSAALGLFLESWLNQVCADVAAQWKNTVNGLTSDSEKEQRVKRPYIIYAGGDDLFIVGPWDVLPELARRIRRDWESYARKGYVDTSEKIRAVSAPSFASALPLTLSAGIFAESAKFPLYQAAEQAREALSRAKQRTALVRRRGEENQEVVKDAIGYLGQTLTWPQFERAQAMAYNLARLIDVGKDDEHDPNKKIKLTHGFLALLGAVAQQFKADAESAEKERNVHGRWMWRLAYGLRRTADRYPQLRQEVMTIAGDALNLDLTTVEGVRQWDMAPLLNLPVRWAAFLIRKGG